MPNKHILVLANSMKHAPCKCVAGKEVQSRGETYTIGRWIRPVSNHGEGELSPSDIWLASARRQPRVMDFVDVPLAKARPEPTQPENWLVDDKLRWSLLSTYQRPDLSLLEDDPSDLWLEPYEQTDRVSSAHLSRHPAQNSLYLVKPERFRVRFGWREWDGSFRQRRRAVFEYKGEEYDMSITDPDFTEKHGHRIPPQGGSVEFTLDDESDVYVCVSLAPSFRGHHYKLVATIFE